jgi:hypothetical protein
MKVRYIIPTENEDGCEEVIVSVNEAIQIQKATAAKVRPDFTYKDDDEALLDYLTIHWAQLIPE